MTNLPPATHLSVEARTHLENLPDSEPADLTDRETLLAVRAIVEEEWTALVDEVDGDWLSAEADDGGVRTVWFTPGGGSESSDGVIVYTHGGSFLFGSPESTANVAAAVAIHSQLPVVSIDYRLAPEHPCPAGVSDAVAAITAIGKEHRIAGLFGDSAGGGLALAAAMTLRDQGGPLPERLALIAPWVDLSCSGDSYRTNMGVNPNFTDPNEPLTIARLYSSDPVTFPASPLAGDPSGLPPTLVQVGGREILLSDSTRLARHMRQAGVECRLDIWDGLWHVWHQRQSIPEAQQATAELAQFLTSG